MESVMIHFCLAYNCCVCEYGGCYKLQKCFEYTYYAIVYNFVIFTKD